MGSWRVLMAGTLLASFGRTATPVAVGDLVQHPAHFFDLDYQRLAFRSGRPVAARRSAGLLERGERAEFGAVELSFAFPFAGRRWDRVWINLTGCLTFGGPDGEFPYRVTWADGTMRSRAAMADLAAARGESFMIAPLWGIHDREGAKVWRKRSARALTVTWEVARYRALYEGYDPLGRNTFQATLYANGDVEFRYAGIAEKDAITGIFSGPPRREQALTGLVSDAGSLIHFVLPADEAAGQRLFVQSGQAATALEWRDGRFGAFGVAVRQGQATATDPVMPVAGWRDGARVHYLVPKLALAVPGEFRWRLGNEGAFQTVRLKRAGRFGADLSAGRDRVDGTLFEVFHYPALWKSRHATFLSIHERVEGNAELAIAFTDFRIDDLHNHGASNHFEGEQRPAVWLGSKALLSMAGPVFLGPRFAEVMVTPERTYKNHAFGVGWMAHEMVHLWGVDVRHTPAIMDPGFHWAPLLETKVMARVAPLFADPPYREGSLMGGVEVFPVEGGRFAAGHSQGAASGLSAFDLWMMGLLRPEEAPAGHAEARLIQPEKDGFATIRLTDVAAENRTPRARAPIGFRQAVYVLHENGRAVRAEALALAASLERALLRYYDAASQGRMRVRTAE